MNSIKRTATIFSLILASVTAGCGKAPETASPTDAKEESAPAKASPAKSELASYLATLPAPPLASFAAPTQVGTLSDLAATQDHTISKRATIAIDGAVAVIKQRRQRGDAASPHREEEAANEVAAACQIGDVAGARRGIAELEDTELRKAMSVWVEAVYGSASLDDAIEKVAALAPKMSGRFMYARLHPLLTSVEPIHTQLFAKMSDALLPDDGKWDLRLDLARRTLARSGDKTISVYRWFFSLGKAGEPPKQDVGIGQLLSEAVATSWNALTTGEANIKSSEPPTKGEFETTPAFGARRAAFEKELNLRTAVDPAPWPFSSTLARV